jgi:hypothetical protein
MHPDMALSLYNYGFKTKADFYKWVYDRTVLPVSQYSTWPWYDDLTNKGTAIESTSGKAYNALPPDYPVHVWGKMEDQGLIEVQGRRIRLLDRKMTGRFSGRGKLLV